jgi:phage shock protein C
MFMGVCQGISRHFHINVFWVRLLAAGLFLFTGFWPMGVIYILAGLILKMEPAIPFENETDQEFYHSFTTSRESAIQRLKRKFDNLERRIRQMEDIVTSRDFH